MPEAKDDLKREKVRIVPISNIEDFPDHPFQVKDDESMDQLVESICTVSGRRRTETHDETI